MITAGVDQRKMAFPLIETLNKMNLYHLIQKAGQTIVLPAFYYFESHALITKSHNSSYEENSTTSIPQGIPLSCDFTSFAWQDKKSSERLHCQMEQNFGHADVTSTIWASLLMKDWYQ